MKTCSCEFMKITLTNLENQEKIIYLLNNAAGELNVTNLAEIRSYITDSKVCFNLEISQTVITIGARAFFNLQNLIQVTLPETLRYIGEQAFASCIRLESINIPDSVNQISRHAFNGCFALESLDMKDLNKRIFDRTHNTDFGRFTPGKTFLEWTLGETKSLTHQNLHRAVYFKLPVNYALLAFNTILKHTQDIRPDSLPVLLKKKLLINLNADNHITRERLLNYLLDDNLFLKKLREHYQKSKNIILLCSPQDLNNSKILSRLFACDDDIFIEKIVQRYIKKNKIKLLTRLIEENNTNKDQKLDLSLLEKKIKDRTKSIYFKKLSFPNGLFQSFLDCTTLNSLLCTSKESHLDQKKPSQAQLQFLSKESSCLRGSCQIYPTTRIRSPIRAPRFKN